MISKVNKPVIGVFFMLAVPLFLHAQNSTSMVLAKADSLFSEKKWVPAKKLYESVLTDTNYNEIAWNRLGFCNYNLRLYML